METTSTDARDEKPVGGCTVDGTTQTGCLPTGVLDTSGIEISAPEATDATQGEGNSRCLTPEDDGIGPDDAPEVALEDIDEEVCALSSKYTAAGLMPAYCH